MEKVKITSSLKEIFDRVGIPQKIQDYFEVDKNKTPTQDFNEVNEKNPFEGS